MIHQKPSNDYAINCNDSAFLPNDFAMICNDLQCFCNDFPPVLSTSGHMANQKNPYCISLSADSKGNLKAMMQ